MIITCPGVRWLKFTNDLEVNGIVERINILFNYVETIIVDKICCNLSSQSKLQLLPFLIFEHIQIAIIIDGVINLWFFLCLVPLLPFLFVCFLSRLLFLFRLYRPDWTSERVVGVLIFIKHVLGLNLTFTASWLVRREKFYDRVADLLDRIPNINQIFNSWAIL